MKAKGSKKKTGVKRNDRNELQHRDRFRWKNTAKGG